MLRLKSIDVKSHMVQESFSSPVKYSIPASELMPESVLSVLASRVNSFTEAASSVVNTPSPLVSYWLAQ